MNLTLDANNTLLGLKCIMKSQLMKNNYAFLFPCSNGIRKKREIGIGDAFRVPGTRWCGVGSSANDLRQMGGFTGADKCCRFHDLGCPFFIPGFGENYGLFNWRFMTLNHCTCDER